MGRNFYRGRTGPALGPLVHRARAVSIGAVFVAGCHARAEEREGEDKLYDLAQVLLETCTMADECSDWDAGSASASELEACAIARVTRAHWAGPECIAPIEEYYACVLAELTDCDLWLTTGAADACRGLEQKVYAVCPEITLPL